MKRVVGNHDVAAAFGLDCRSDPKLYQASVRTRERITFQKVPTKALRVLGRAERVVDLAYGGLRVRALHARPGDELYGALTKEEASNLEVRSADLLVLGHTHVPFEVKDGARWIVNPGSVGMPLDGNPRASYAVLDTHEREVQFGRVEYDVEQTLSKLRQLMGDEEQVYDFLAGVFRTASLQKL